jgi:protein-disulfide isomerase
VLSEVLAKYEGKIRHVFMDFPLEAIHPMAHAAAVAGGCANEQRKFWDYHKILFERQKELSADNFKKWAGELGLDEEKFAECLESKRYEAAIRESIESGKNVGVNGTPRFFINGVALSGAQPADAFQEIIDDELSQKS